MPYHNSHRRRSPPRSQSTVVVAEGGLASPPFCHRHGGVPVPMSHCGTSSANGLPVHHFRCVVNPRHHERFIRLHGRWRKMIGST